MGTVKQNQKEKKGGGKKTLSIIILVCIILVMGGVIVYLLSFRKPAETERRNEIVTPDNVEEMIQQMDEDEFVSPGYYTVTMNFDWHFTTGDAISSNAYVENALDNTNAVYLDIFLAEDEENAIYKSPVIPVGGILKDIALDTPLSAGKYDCIAVYHLVDDEQNTISTLRVTVTITIDE